MANKAALFMAIIGSLASCVAPAGVSNPEVTSYSVVANRLEGESTSFWMALGVFRVTGLERVVKSCKEGRSGLYVVTKYGHVNGVSEADARRMMSSSQSHFLNKGWFPVRVSEVLELVDPMHGDRIWIKWIADLQRLAVRIFSPCFRVAQGEAKPF